MRYIGTVTPCDPSTNQSAVNKLRIKSDSGTEYVLCNLIGKTIYAGENTAVYEHPTAKTPRYGVAKGSPIGVLSSALDYGTHIFLTFELKPGEIGKIVFLKPNTISDKGLKSQKIPNAQQQQQQYDQWIEDENTPWYEDISTALVSGAKYAAIGLGLWIAYDFIKSNKPRN